MQFSLCRVSSSFSCCPHTLCFHVAVDMGQMVIPRKWFFPALFVHRARRESRLRLLRQGPAPWTEMVRRDDDKSDDDDGLDNYVEEEAGQKQRKSARSRGRSPAAIFKTINPYLSRCHCTAFAVFVGLWSLLSVGFGIHHLFSV